MFLPNVEVNAAKTGHQIQENHFKTHNWLFKDPTHILLFLFSFIQPFLSLETAKNLKAEDEEDDASNEDEEDDSSNQSDFTYEFARCPFCDKTGMLALPCECGGFFLEEDDASDKSDSICELGRCPFCEKSGILGNPCECEGYFI